MANRLQPSTARIYGFGLFPLELGSAVEFGGWFWLSAKMECHFLEARAAFRYSPLLRNPSEKTKGRAWSNGEDMRLEATSCRCCSRSNFRDIAGVVGGYFLLEIGAGASAEHFIVCLYV